MASPRVRTRPSTMKREASSTVVAPRWATTEKYRTMNKKKKTFAVRGDKRCQLEWMKEEVNEFYEAVLQGEQTEILDEAVGLIRAAQQFSHSKRVQVWWRKVESDVKKVLGNKRQYAGAYREWKRRKTLKNQANGVTSEMLVRFAGLDW